MGRIRFVLVAALCGFGCGDDGGGLDDYYPTLPPTGGASVASAGQVTDESQLITGPAKSGLVGAFFIKNDVVSFIVQSPTRVIGVVPQEVLFHVGGEDALKSREEAKSLRELLSFSKKEKKDPLSDYLLSFKDRMGNAKNLLTDEALSAFFFVTLPESLPIAVITRFINWFHEFGIPVGGVVVNGVIQKEQVGKDAAEFVLNRIQMQDEHTGEIWKIFGDRVRAIVPLFETEVKGAKMLNRTIEYLFTPSSR